MRDTLLAMRAILVLFCMTLQAQTGDKPVRAVTDPGVVTTRQAITPAGVPMVFEGRVHGVVFGKTAAELWVLNASRLYRLDWRANRIVETVAHEGSPGLQGIAFQEKPFVAITRKGTGVGLYAPEGGKLTSIAGKIGDVLAGAIALSPTVAVVPLVAKNQLAVIDVQSGKLAGSASTGIAPFGAVVSRDGAVAFVTNWGGRVANAGDRTAKSGPDATVIDERGVASTGTVTRIDLKTLKETHTIAVGLHPTAIVWDEPGQRVYVANGNNDSVSVIDSTKMTVVRTIAIEPFAAKARGIAPTALALSADRKTLFVACGGINAVAVVNAESGAVLGLIPTAWYPNSLALSPDGESIAVGALLGVGPGWREAPNKRYVHADRGSVAVIRIPDRAQLASFTAAVTVNNRMQAVVNTVATNALTPRPVPARVGDPSTIEHVVLIVKENRSYDQVFGDIAKGNGDASLVMFGRDVTPNQHKLAEDFVLLDNFFATGGNSADGHQWITQANETDYALWPGYTGRSYPFDGNDPIAYSKSGFLWDYALARKKSVRVYGEYAPAIRIPMTKRPELLARWKKGDDFSRDWQVSSPIPALDKLLVKNFPTFSTSIPDVARAQIYLADLKRMERENSMPNLTMMLLPSDHTRGTDPGESTAPAMVADNDLAVGQIVEGLSKSKFWPKMAIFIVEDDAQNGVDHVDGHRTVALAVSPYTRRGHIDSTFYSTQSMIKTIELMLGLPTMSLFDLIAEDMRESFQTQPDVTPYQAVDAKISLFDTNPPLRSLKAQARADAAASARMRFDIPDAAPSEKLNRILWRAVRGNIPYPGAHRAAFVPFSLDIDDDDRK
jgi:YVTN family beta-propeller protein